MGTIAYSSLLNTLKWDLRLVRDPGNHKFAISRMCATHFMYIVNLGKCIVTLAAPINLLHTNTIQIVFGIDGP